MSDSSESANTAKSNVTTRRCTPRQHGARYVPSEEKVVWSHMAKANMKVPPFSPEDPEIWFALLEGQMDNYGIVDDHARYTQVITNLDMGHAKAVKDIIINPPAKGKYERIKQELIRRLSASHEKKVKQLLTHEELGDRKPSQFLRHLQDLAGPSVPEDFVRSIWSNRLPHNLQTILASQPNLPLEQLADLADRVQEVTSPPSYQVSATSAAEAPPGQSVGNEIAELRRMVERLEMKLDQQTRQPSDSRHSRSRQPRRSTSRQRSRSRSDSNYRQYPICWYHQQFGSRAQHCSKPCDYKAGNAKGNW